MRSRQQNGSFGHDNVVERLGVEVGSDMQDNIFADLQKKYPIDNVLGLLTRVIGLFYTLGCLVEVCTLMCLSPGEYWVMASISAVAFSPNPSL